MLKLVARHADVWSAAGPLSSAPDTVVELTDQFDAACDAVGRNPADVRRSIRIGFGGDPAQTIDAIGRFHELGFTELVLMVRPYGFSAGSGDPVRAAELIAERVLPEARKVQHRQ
jgi:alkanesulfonate monooxygenase SsuD/methylene tetrahydromethanopterin reductase-like flavin-dependent oxidoreductase (luciferase family)